MRKLAFAVNPAQTGMQHNFLQRLQCCTSAKYLHCVSSKVDSYV